MSSISADDAIALLVMHLCTKRKREKEEQKKKEITQKRQCVNEKQAITKQILSDDFNNFLRMDSVTYTKILDMVMPLIKKQNSIWRDAISPNERLSATLKFLTTGQCYDDLNCSANVSAENLGHIILETCEVLINALKSFIQIPQNEEEWKMVSEEFEKEWNFNNCIGAIGGKHINIIKPKDSPFDYCNYKKKFSIAIMAMVNANYEFTTVEVGVNGKIPEEGIFEYSELMQQFEAETLNLPEPEELPKSNEVVPYVLLGDEAFPLMEYLMKPYSRQHLTIEERIFNYRLSKAQHIVENAFSIMTNRFKILLNKIQLSPEKTSVIALTCCYLHNYLMKYNPSIYLRRNADDSETKQLADLEPLRYSSATTNAKRIRTKFCNYFNAEGAVAWQNKFD